MNNICAYKNPIPWKDKDFLKEYIKDGNKEFIYSPSKPWINDLHDEAILGNISGFPSDYKHISKSDLEKELIVIEGKNNDKQ